MKFLLDENAGGRLGPYLRALGHNVAAIAVDHPASLNDRAVLQIAHREGRILITDDRDFGELVVVHSPVPCRCAYVIDSDVVIDHLADEPDARQLLARLSDDGLAISVVTSTEVYQGTLNSPDMTPAQTQFAAFLADVPVIPFSAAVARRCADVRLQPKRQRKRVRPRALDSISRRHGSSARSDPRDPQHR